MTEVIRCHKLVKHFPIYGGILNREIATLKAVQEVSLSIDGGKTLGLVGESGCGKSTLGRSLIRLLEPTSGDIYFKGENITRLSGARLRSLRKHLQIVFQDPFSSLNPRMTVREILEEPLRVHKIFSEASQLQRRTKELLELVGLPLDALNRYPHEFSGGQRQRIGIARALAVEPELIILDEPVSALDVSVQAQIINLLLDLQRQFGLTYLFIAHDLKVVEHVSDEVAVMYLGHIVESGPSRSLYQNPQHPYTQALLSAIPLPTPKRNRQRIILKGDVPSPINPPSGCPFHPRCPKAQPKCEKEKPILQKIPSAIPTTASDHNHQVACFYPG
ncbi:MAG: dipeptide ABC transporter ATP-binding protein [Bdellovibrionaceae bacterium]|nr:dipeptide ABC transporter ATP-binding protein [Pseudobdellovibrionaceae bacterium]MDW8190538.1 dipeptide ABC transporter ATP-binding protein [Pseudobdellovibrionaceae bacterium]